MLLTPRNTRTAGHGVASQPGSPEPSETKAAYFFPRLYTVNSPHRLLQRSHMFSCSPTSSEKTVQNITHDFSGKLTSAAYHTLDLAAP